MARVLLLVLVLELGVLELMLGLTEVLSRGGVGVGNAEVMGVGAELVTGSDGTGAAGMAQGLLLLQSLVVPSLLVAWKLLVLVDKDRSPRYWALSPRRLPPLGHLPSPTHPGPPGRSCLLSLTPSPRGPFTTHQVPHSSLNSFVVCLLPISSGGQ